MDQVSFATTKDGKFLLENAFNATESQLDLFFCNIKNNPFKSFAHSAFGRFRNQTDAREFLEYRFKDKTPFNHFIPEICLFIMLCKRHNRFVQVVEEFLKEKEILK